MALSPSPPSSAPRRLMRHPDGLPWRPPARAAAAALLRHAQKGHLRLITELGRLRSRPLSGSAPPPACKAPVPEHPSRAALAPCAARRPPGSPRMATWPSPVQARESVAVPPPLDVERQPDRQLSRGAGGGRGPRHRRGVDLLPGSAARRSAQPELVERTFVAALSNGDVDEALDFARRLVRPTQERPRPSGARRRQITTAMGRGAARVRSGGAGREHDVTATLLTAWSYAGQGDEKKALAAIDGLKDSGFARVPRLSRGADRRLANDLPEATKRYKTAYAEDKTILRLVDAYARFEARHGAKAEAMRALGGLREVLPHHPLIEADWPTSRPARRSCRWSRPPRRARPRCSTGSGRRADARATNLPP